MQGSAAGQSLRHRGCRQRDQPCARDAAGGAPRAAPRDVRGAAAQRYQPMGRALPRDADPAPTRLLAVRNRSSRGRVGQRLRSFGVTTTDTQRQAGTAAVARLPFASTVTISTLPFCAALLAADARPGAARTLVAVPNII